MEGSDEMVPFRMWRSYGVTVKVSTANIVKEDGSFELIMDANKLGTVKAIFHLAVVLKDALFENQTVESFADSFVAKAQSASHLDKISRLHCPRLT